MAKYEVILLVDATITVVVNAENEDDAKEKAMDTAAPPALCHHCSEQLSVNDVSEAIEAYIIEWYII